MKSDHRHELKTNELADWILHFPDWARQNRTNLIAVGVVLVVALFVYFWSFYRKDIVSTRNQARLTTLVTQVPQQMSNVARAAAQGTEQSYVLLPVAQDLQDFAQKSSDDNMAALALIQRAAALRAELHYRLNDVAPDELATQIGKAKESYQQALERKPSNPTLAAAAHFGLGLCEEELGNFDQARAIYGEVAQKPEYVGTTAQAAAAHRLTIMDDYKTELVFKPAPPKPEPAQKPPAPQIQVRPGDANAPFIGPMPQDANASPATPSAAPDANKAPAAVPGKPDANAPTGN